MKKLIVVESPAKAKTIKNYLNGLPDKFEITASYGHIIDLPGKEIAVDMEDNFKAKWTVIPKKNKVISEIKSRAKASDEVLLAPDPDREGESIAYHIKSIIPEGKPVYRITFNEITKGAVIQAVNNLKDIDMNKVNSQFARRILDRIAGYKLSPVLWRKVQKGLSAGRVQSIALKLIVERQREIQKFQPEEYWTVDALLNAKGVDFKSSLIKIKGKKAKIKNEGSASEISSVLKKYENFKLSELQKKVAYKSPPPPYITSKLQQDASRLYNFSPKKTMAVAQKLYEGVKIGKDFTGLITYHRTDSLRVSDSAINTAVEFIKNNFGDDYIGKYFYKKKAGSQDAHEAIRPTYIEHTPESVQGFLSADENKIYSLVYKQFLSSQMAKAKFNTTKYLFDIEGFLFESKGEVELFDGFLKILKIKSKENSLPEMAEGEEALKKSVDLKQNFTKPPAFFTEGSLVKELEKRGIGRPSTYASIVSTILARGYVEKKEKHLHSSKLGEVVCDLLSDNFKYIMDYDFTANLEKNLDLVESGKLDYIALLREFYIKFKTEMEAAGEIQSAKDKLIEETDELCEKCGSKMIIRTGRYGKFMACSNFPACKNTMKLNADNQKAEDVKTEYDCPNCGVKLVIKTTRRGRFLACPAFPKCRHIAPLPTGEKCPECKDGDIVERYFKGRKFYSCSNYPECKYTVKDKGKKEKKETEEKVLEEKEIEEKEIEEKEIEEKENEK